MKFKGKMLTGFGSIILVVSVFITIGLFSLTTNSRLTEKIDAEIVPDALHFMELKQEVIQVQQWLTDISATRAAEGYNDGFKEAEKHFKNGNKIIDDFMKTKTDETELMKQLDEMKTNFSEFYKMGRKLANAYITGGSVEGNKLMNDFDKIAKNLTGPMEKFVMEHENELKESTHDMKRRVDFIFMFFLGGILVTVVISLVIALTITGRMVKPIQQGLNLAKKLAEGDLTERVEVDLKDEVGMLINELNRAAVNLTDLISNVISSSQNLAQVVEQIAGGNQNLSQRTSEQASSLEEIASTVEENQATTNQNAQNAAEANSFTEASYKMADKGGKISSEAVTGINEISEVSKKIGDITNVINEISFQTNLLALNAAVEAARAGEAGRGFAVVAGEIRNLAQRSGNAAKEIEELIKDTVGKIENGASLVNKSGESLAEIIISIKKVSDIVNEISLASKEQKQGMDQLNEAIIQMDNMTQQNASLVEETASASEEMANQAQELLSLTTAFKIEGGETAAVRQRKQIHIHGLEKHADKPAEEKPRDFKGVVADKKAGGDIKDAMADEGFEEV